MRFDKLTTKFQQALNDAQSLALGNDNGFIEPQHLLAALLAQEDGGTPGIGAFALQRIEDLLDRVGSAHCAAAPMYRAGSRRPASEKPFRRSWHESQRPHAAPSALGS